MYASELRTCALGGVVCVLLGVGIGYGWHYLDTGGGRAAVALAATPLAQEDAPSAPHRQNPLRKGAPLSISSRFLVYPITCNQPEASRDALKAILAGNISVIS